MGTWGTGLFDCDLTLDVKDDYLELIRKGMSNREAVEFVKRRHVGTITGEEDEALLWYALADTQWNVGRLTEDVKKEAYHFLSQNENEDRWEDPNQREAWIKTCERLREKLLSPQPPEKKLRSTRSYRCQWQFGDVFAYRMRSDFSKENGTFGKYILFRKVSEATWHPNHRIPVVQLYNWVGDTLPSIEEVKQFKVVPTPYYPSINLWSPVTDFPETLYSFELIIKSKKSVQEQELVYLGRIDSGDFFPWRDSYIPFYSVGWETSKYNIKIEHYAIEVLENLKKTPIEQ